MVHWLQLCAPNTGGPGLIPGWGTRSHILHLRVHVLHLEIFHASTKMEDLALPCPQICGLSGMAGRLGPLSSHGLSSSNYLAFTESATDGFPFYHVMLML